MNFQEEDYEKFTKEEINNLNNLKFHFVLNDRFVYAKDNEGKYFQACTPLLKVLKPIHTTLNKKKTIAKKYIILETNDELDFNNQIGDFMFVINKIHEISQEKIREKSMEWFNTEFDDIGLDIKVRRPIDQQKDSEFIRIALPKNEDMEKAISMIEKGSYIICNIIFKGLKVSSEHIMEEWEIRDFITQEKYDEIQNSQYYNNNLVETDVVSNLLLENQQMEMESEEQKQMEEEDHIVMEETIREAVVEPVIGEYVEEVNHVEESVQEEDIQKPIEIIEVEEHKEKEEHKKKIKNREQIKKKKDKSMDDSKFRKKSRDSTLPIKKMSKRIIFA